MARRRTEQLTDDLYRRLGGADVSRSRDQAIVVCTVDADGWPHPAMLSYFEVAARDRHNLRLAVYTNSRTCANMRERGKATLIVVDAGLVCYVRGAGDGAGAGDARGPVQRAAQPAHRAGGVRRAAARTSSLASV